MICVLKSTCLLFKRLTRLASFPKMDFCFEFLFLVFCFQFPFLEFKSFSSFCEIGARKLEKGKGEKKTEIALWFWKRVILGVISEGRFQNEFKKTENQRVFVSIFIFLENKNRKQDLKKCQFPESYSDFLYHLVLQVDDKIIEWTVLVKIFFE